MMNLMRSILLIWVYLVVSEGFRMSAVRVRQQSRQVRSISMEGGVNWSSFLTRGILTTAVATGLSVFLSNGVYALQTQGKDFPVVGSDSIMSTKAHGTSNQPVQVCLPSMFLQHVSFLNLCVVLIGKFTMER